MKVIITGGAGFLGLQLAQRLTALGSLTGASGKAEKIDELLLFDVVTPDKRPAGLAVLREPATAGRPASAGC